MSDHGLTVFGCVLFAVGTVAAGAFWVLAMDKIKGRLDWLEKRVTLLDPATPPIHRICRHIQESRDFINSPYDELTPPLREKDLKDDCHAK
jgi:hypothetical protein